MWHVCIYYLGVASRSVNCSWTHEALCSLSGGSVGRVLLAQNVAMTRSKKCGHAFMGSDLEFCNVSESECEIKCDGDIR
ncbi:hypothetical protein EDB86DRAFT_2932096 [Lactarius hatsudake]|nr:hypothetical protein EDB86DRAFT_2932096 [Lactarius hatsudake]